MRFYFIFAIMTFISAVASLFFKKATGGEGIWQLLKNINLYIGGTLYVVAALMNIYVLRYLDFSVVMPLGAVTYIWTMLLSRICLKENITMKKICGVGLIFLGAVCVAH